MDGLRNCLPEDIQLLSYNSKHSQRISYHWKYKAEVWGKGVLPFISGNNIISNSDVTASFVGSSVERYTCLTDFTLSWPLQTKKNWKSRPVFWESYWRASRFVPAKEIGMTKILRSVKTSFSSPGTHKRASTGFVSQWGPNKNNSCVFTAWQGIFANQLLKWSLNRVLQPRDKLGSNERSRLFDYCLRSSV